MACASLLAPMPPLLLSSQPLTFRARAIRASAEAMGGHGLGESVRVNAWTEWGSLREIVVGNADNANFPPVSPAMRPTINPEGGQCSLLPDGRVEESEGSGAAIQREVGWPSGRKRQATIDAANRQLDNLAEVLSQQGVRVHRPSGHIDWSGSIKTPFFESPNQYCATCPRDIVATIGNIVLEASMSRRDRWGPRRRLPTPACAPLPA